MRKKRVDELKKYGIEIEKEMGEKEGKRDERAV